MLRKTDEKVMKDCQREFKVQRKLFNNSKCFNRIPRPLYILDLLDADLKGVYGFLMEFCIGGSVSSFAKRWCVVDKSESQGEEGDEEEEYSSSEEDCDDHIDFDPMTLNPLKVSALCVGMIECLDDVFTAKPNLTHRDIKPDNFLVRVDPDSKKCTVVLSDLGLVKILDSISSRLSSSGIGDSSSLSSKIPKKESSTDHKYSICGTLEYNSYEALQGVISQKSDAYSLGISILTLFFGYNPFLQIPALRGIESRLDLSSALMKILKDGGSGPTLLQSPLFGSLKTTEEGKFQPIHECLNEVFTGLTQFHIDKRMSVHRARERVQSIKHLLPVIGEGFECPSVEDIIKEQKQKHFGSGTIIGGPMSHSLQETTIKTYDIIDGRDYDESEKESEEQSERDKEHESQSISSLASSYSIPVTSEYDNDSLSISSTNQSSIESRDYLESRGLDREKEE
ncbi:hypothetical protein ADUPG1_000663 [Aduncisulcus paluster]|uniref:Protein kinase domain-containing protein n=1 Tax=Aduncisulcus paluster TaxID=2918883 RepID=A0ABQ5KB80_9EUKA|nr:hypothetical protein ADUPG1_000663 [Aduncisulcus paluster]